MVCSRFAFRYVLLALALGGPSLLFAQASEQKLTDSAHFAGGFDAWSSVSLSGDLAIVGASGVDDDGLDSGSAYIFRRIDGVWVDGDTLTASDGSEGNYFGHSASISGDVAIVGAFGGSVYIFRLVDGEWEEEQRLMPSQGGGEFGGSVSISGDVVIVGAAFDDDNGDQSGAAYIFRRVGGVWIEEQKLTASDGDSGDLFGRSVSISGDVAIVGGGGALDAAYIFRRVGDVWVEEQKLTGDDESTAFGVNVSISGDVALVGDHSDDGPAGTNSGAAYIFRWDGGAWVQEQKLKPGDLNAIDWFGRSVSISGDVAVVGSLFDDDNGTNSGSAYIFRWNGSQWVQEEKLLASDGEEGQNFGGSVFVSGDDVLVRAGASAYAYDLDPSAEPDIVIM